MKNHENVNNQSVDNMNRESSASGIQPTHGWLNFPVSRAEFARQQGWLPDWLASEIEGMKNFPAASISPLVWFPKEKELFGAPFPDSVEFANDGGALPRQIPDGFIISGGREDADRNIVNFTDDELLAAKGVQWPVTDVRPGQVLEINWNTTVWHAVRGYRYFITKNGWNQNQRLAREDLELVPFQSIFNTKEQPWGPNLPESMPAISPQQITLPIEKTGRHIILAVWLVADSAAGFYHAIDVSFNKCP